MLAARCLVSAIAVAFFLGAAPASATIDNSEIHGMKWNDLNGDGVKDGGEPGLPGWEITLSGSGIGPLVVTTDVDGNYWFLGLPEGLYNVSETLQPGWVQTAPATGSWDIQLGYSEIVNDIDFGNRLPEPSALLLAGLGLAGLALRRRA